MIKTKFAYGLVLVLALAGPVSFGVASAQTPPADAAAKPEAAKPADAPKKLSKSELGEMLKKCSDEADAKGLTVQKGKSEARKAYRRSCMLKNGVAPKKK